PFAKRVEPVGFGLQFAQACGQCVEFALRLGAGGVELGLLAGLVGSDQSDAGAGPEDGPRGEQDAGGNARATHRLLGGLPAKTRDALAGMVDEMVEAVEGHAMSGSHSSNAGSRGLKPPGPKAALEALLTGTAADPVRRALWLDALDQRLRPYLPPSLAPHVRLANVNGAKLVFLVDSPVWHARLRLATSELLDAARSVGLDATEVVIRTKTPSSETGTAAPRAALPMSAAAREALEAALSSLRIPSDPDADGKKPRR